MQSRFWIVAAIALAGALGVPASGTLAASAATPATRGAAGGSTVAAAGRSGARKHPTGDVVVRAGALQNTRVHVLGSAVRSAASLPTSAYLTGYLVTPGDQGQLGACVSWALGHSLMGYWANRDGLSTTLFAPMYLYSQTHATNDADGGGSSVEDAYQVLADQGIAPESVWTQGDYSFLEPPTTAETTAAAAYKTKATASAPETLIASSADGIEPSAGVRAALESEISQGYPVTITIPVDATFENLDATDWTLNESTVGADLGSHEVLAVGYDSFGLRIENSWGTEWGQRGYATISWAFITNELQEAADVHGLAAYSPASALQLASAPAWHGVGGLKASSRARGTLTATWTAPTSTGGYPVTGYRVSWVRLTATGAATGSTSSRTVRAGTTATVLTGLRGGTRYRVSVTPATIATAAPAASTTATARRS